MFDYNWLTRAHFSILLILDLTLTQSSKGRATLSAVTHLASACGAACFSRPLHPKGQTPDIYQRKKTASLVWSNATSTPRQWCTQHSCPVGKEVRVPSPPSASVLIATRHRYNSLHAIIFLQCTAKRVVVAGDAGCRLNPASSFLVQVPPRPTKPSIPPRSANCYQTCLGSLKHWFFHQLTTASHSIGQMRIQAAMMCRRGRIPDTPQQG